MKRFLLAPLFLLSALFLLNNEVVVVVDGALYKSGNTEEWKVHSTGLPHPISDHSATLDPTTGRVYIVGGCNSTNGNIRLTPNDTKSDFYCPDVTNRAYIFDATTGNVETLPPAPRPRYRHAAVYHQGLIWYIGGRDASFNDVAMVDNIVYEIDVLDTKTNRWREDLSTLVLNTTIARSDGTAFVIEDTIYLVGGYELGYNATTETFAIDIPLSLENKVLSYSTRASLHQERGDCHAAVVGVNDDGTGGVAYVVGGFTHKDSWCEALDDVERYRPFDDAWERLSESQSLTYARGDKAVVAVGSRLYVIGGESKTDCALEPGQRTHPTAQVEILETANGDAAAWTEEIADIPKDHFRFPAVSYKGIIYTFGGQNYYNAVCDCFPTSANILTYDTTVIPAKTDTTSGGAAAPWVIPATTVSMVLSLLALY